MYRNVHALVAPNRVGGTFVCLGGLPTHCAFPEAGIADQLVQPCSYSICGNDTQRRIPCSVSNCEVLLSNRQSFVSTLARMQGHEQM